MNAAGPTESRWLALLTLAVVISRVPLLIAGYGADPDAWRVAFVAKKFWATGIFEVSRFPGYPLHELVSVLPVAIGGSLTSNIATVLCSLAVIILWADIVKANARYPCLLMVAFAFAPLFWINSAATMDYVWSILFLLVSYREILNGHPVRSGLAFGVALGFRPSNVVVASAMIVVLLLRTGRWRNLTTFAVSAGISALVSFLPVLCTYGITGWVANTREHVAVMNESSVMHILLFGYRTVYAIGPLATIATIVILIHKWQEVRAHLRRANVIFVSSLSAVSAILLLFYALPLERSYLLPLMPFLLLILDAVASRNAMLVMVTCLLSFGVVNPDVIRHTGIHGTPEFHVRPGIVIEDYVQKRAILARRDFLSSYPFRENTIVMTGVGPVFWVENPLVEPLEGQNVNDIRDITVKSLTKRNVLFTPMLEKATLDSIRRSGFSIVCVSDLREYIETSGGYLMNDEGIDLVDMPAF